VDSWRLELGFMKSGERGDDGRGVALIPC